MTPSRITPRSLSAALLLWSGSISVFLAACSDAQAGADAAKSAPGPKAVPALSLADKAIPAHQAELLDLAFQTATALPLEPHIKNRARAQEAVFVACLELDQPRRALAYAEQIPNWRKGAALADVAYYCAEHGDTDAVQHYLDLALRLSEDEEIGQDWRRDRIRTKVARVYALVGRAADAEALSQDAVDSEAAEARAAQALQVDLADLEAELEALQDAMLTGSLDQARNALNASARLFDHFYEDGSARARVKEAIKKAWTKLPVMIRIEVLMELTRFALDHQDQDEALKLVEEARQMFDANDLVPEDQIATSAKLAGLRYRAGDRETARSEVDAARAAFDDKKEKIVDIYRADALRVVAEAYQTMEDATSALEVYGKALEEGVHNPNSWPRAEDLSATCSSMALHGVEPDAATWARMREIYAALGPLW